MKKQDILTLVNAGALSATQHELSSAHSYKVFKFKSNLRKALTALQEAENDLQKECGIEDGQAFDERLAELRKLEAPTEAETKELEEMNAKLLSYIEQQRELYNEDIDLDVKTMPYEEWCKLQNENKAVEINGTKHDVFSGYVEELLLDVLWKAPEEEE